MTQDLLISIDDTDDKESTPTGQLLEQIGRELVRRRLAVVQPITRHQLHVHPDIPYTTHNSAMCFAATAPSAGLEELTAYVADRLERDSAPTADPGFCLVLLPLKVGLPELVEFGWRAKREVLTKAAAYALAREYGIHLSEHGGTGQGVIGALAGAGLRLGGNDGRFKGRHSVETQDGWSTVAAIRASTFIDEVRALDGTVLTDSERVILGDKTKSVLLNGRCVLLVCPTSETTSGVRWEACPPEVWRQH